jgi:hypothetical protein
VINKIRECERDKIKVIVMGDFNDIRSRELDQNKNISNRKQALPLLRWLEKSDLEDVFRKAHADAREFTWSNGVSSSRIDYIWASSALSHSILSCAIIESQCITGSDHSIVYAKLSTGIMQKLRKEAVNKRLKGKKRILRLDKAQEEDWENYRAKLDTEVLKKLGIESNIELIERKCANKSLNELWDIIYNCITSSANATLPSQKVYAGTKALRKLDNSDIILKDLRRLGKICHMCAKGKLSFISEDIRWQVNLEFMSLNSKYDLQIEELNEEYWSDEREKSLKIW